MSHHLPVDGAEEGVRDDVREACVGVTPQPVRGVLVKEALEDTGRLHGQRTRDTDGPLQDNCGERKELGINGRLKALHGLQGRVCEELNTCLRLTY